MLRSKATNTPCHAHATPESTARRTVSCVGMSPRSNSEACSRSKLVGMTTRLDVREHGTTVAKRGAA